MHSAYMTAGGEIEITADYRGSEAELIAFHADEGGLRAVLAGLDAGRLAWHAGRAVHRAAGRTGCPTPAVSGGGGPMCGHCVPGGSWRCPLGGAS